MPASSFMFATGIENSIPTIDNGRRRIDQMEKCGHYKRWREDFQLLRELDIHFLRYGPPLHRTFIGPGRYDWEFADITFSALMDLDIVPIVDLCHFGVPDWIGNFQNPDFPDLFADYAQAFAERFPWVQLYTPINEMFICALFSGLLRLVERAAAERQGIRDGFEAHREGERSRHVRASSKCGPTRSSSKASPRNITTRRIRPRSRQRKS